MPNDHNGLAIIILAAGSSSRLGKPKQLLPYKNTTLLVHAIKTAAETRCQNITAVTGANHELILQEISSLNIHIIENKQWQTGMASSIHAGINFIKDKAEIHGALIMLCDQPLITSAHLNELIASFSQIGNNKIIATGYKGIAGVPAIFPKDSFALLLNLKGDEGARKLIKSHTKEISVIAFDNAFLDIDTGADYQILKNISTDNNV